YVSRQRLTAHQRDAILCRSTFCISIQQETHAFCTAHHRSSSCGLNKVGDCRNRNVFTGGKFVSPAHHCRTFNSDSSLLINIGSIRVICYHSAPAWTNAGNDCRAIYHCGAGIHSVVIAESDSFPAELPECGSCFLSDKVGTHSIPYQYNHTPIRFCRTGSDAANTRRKNEDKDRHPYAIFPEHDWSQITQTASDW